MHSSHHSTKQEGEASQFLIYLLIATVLALPGLLLGWMLRSFVRREPGNPVRRVVAAAITLLCAGLLYYFREAYPLIAPELRALISRHAWEQIPRFMGVVWIFTAPTTPIHAVLIDLLKPKSVDELHREQQRQEAQRDTTERATAARKATAAPEVHKGDLVLGALVRGDLPWMAKGLVTYPAQELKQHAVVVGGSGSGKTETLLRLAYLAAKVYRWHVIYVDAKGDTKTAGRFLATMQAAGVGNSLMFPTRKYDGWRGDWRAISNRLMAIQDYSEPYYEATAQLVISLAVKAPAGVPRSSMELLRRFNRDTLLELYAGHADEETVRRLKVEDVEGVFRRYAGYFDALDGCLDGTWSLEDVESAYILLDGTALKKEARALGRYLVEDISHYVTARKDAPQQVLIIIDEFSALSMATDAANLFERIRSFGAAVIVSSQSYAGLGDDADRILGAATGLVLHQCGDPEQLVRRAGQVRELDRTMQVKGQGATGLGSLRTTDRLRVDPNMVQQLGPGECFMIARGRAAHVKVSQIGQVDEGAGRALVNQGGWLVYIRYPKDQTPLVTARPVTSQTTTRNLVQIQPDLEEPSPSWTDSTTRPQDDVSTEF